MKVRLSLASCRGKLADPKSFALIVVKSLAMLGGCVVVVVVDVDVVGSSFS